MDEHCAGTDPARGRPHNVRPEPVEGCRVSLDGPSYSVSVDSHSATLDSHSALLVSPHCLASQS